MKEEKISSYQIVMLIAGFFLGTSIVLNPAAKDGADVWFTGLVAIASGLLVTCLTVTIAVKHPNKSLVEILIFCFGGVVGRIIGFFIFYLPYGCQVRLYSLSAITATASATLKRLSCSSQFVIC